MPAGGGDVPQDVPRGVLETSYWVAAHRADVAANTLDLYRIVVPPAVEAEILRPEAGHPLREFPYATLFHHLRSRMSDPPVPAPTPLPILGKGEAEAISLAQHLDVALLINERRGRRHARSLDIAVVSVPDVIVVLALRDVISHRAAHRKLDLIAPITPPDLVREARELLGPR